MRTTHHFIKSSLSICYNLLGGGKNTLLTFPILLATSLLGGTLLTVSCVPSVAEPDWNQDTRFSADSTSGDSAQFTVSINPWEPGDDIYGYPVKSASVHPDNNNSHE